MYVNIMFTYKEILLYRFNMLTIYRTILSDLGRNLTENGGEILIFRVFARFFKYFCYSFPFSWIFWDFFILIFWGMIFFILKWNWERGSQREFEFFSLEWHFLSATEGTDCWAINCTKVFWKSSFFPMTKYETCSYAI